MSDVTLTEFLMARLGEDEAEARADSPHDDTDADRGAPDYHDRYFARVDLHKRQPHGLECAWRVGEGLEKSCFCDYPARVLRDVEAKRRTLGAHEPVTRWDGRLKCGKCASMCHSHSGLGCDEPYDAPWPCDEIRNLASVYADHEDFREEWRPSEPSP